MKTKLREVGLQLNDEKCIQLLGHTNSKDGVKPDTSKIDAIVNMPPPTDVSELKRYSRMVNYLGRDLPNLSSVLKPFSWILDKETAWQWSSQQAQAFAIVKTLLTTAPTLPTLTLPSQLP